MGLLDLFKANENKQLKDEIAQLKYMMHPEYNNVDYLLKEIKRLGADKEKLEKDIKKLDVQNANLNNEISKKKQELIVFDEEILMQEFGLYRPMYDFANSEQYKDKLESIRQRQQDMISIKTAVNYFDGWTVDGSKSKGRKMTNDNIKQILRSFNNECENAIDRVKFNNIESMRKRIIKAYETLNKLNDTNKVSITNNFLELKLEELNLAHEYQLKKQEEKEEQKRIREEMREEAKLQKELEEARKNIDKELKHFNIALDKVNSQLSNDNLSEEQRELLLAKKVELENQIQELNDNLKDIDYRQENAKAGYVYIISNVGAFGEDVYKIGMTRRLEPMDRVDELGDASVPFNFDVHAMIFTPDAPKLENALHKAFENKKVNMVNSRREFFYVTLDEIKQVVKANFDKTVEFTSIPEAEQYRQSLKIKGIK